MIQKVLIVAIFLAGSGLVDTGYLTYSFYTDNDPNCVLLEGCDLVTKSVYNNLYGFPLALLGFSYYLIALALLVHLYQQSVTSKATWWIMALTALGFGFSIWLTYLQLVVIRSICIYCVVSAVVSTCLFIISIYLWRQRRLALLPVAVAQTESSE